MAWTEDPTDFLVDFGVTVTASGTTGLGILDMPGEYLHNERVITNEYLLRAETSKFGTLSYNDSIAVEGVAYTVREQPLKVDDGTFCLVLLTKDDTIPPAAQNLTTISGLNLTTILGIPLATLP
jgi:hypothetical protein